jgi:glycosyltransferase involved in cell wall biosynthesis
VNILFVEEVDWLQKVVYEIHSLPEALSSLGHNVFFIDFEESWRRNRILDFGTLKTKEFNRLSRVHSKASITLIRPGFIKAPFLDRTSAFITHYLEIERTIKQRKIDAIVLYSCPTNGLQTIKLAKKHNVPVIYRSMDIQHMLVRNRPHVHVPNGLLKSITYSLEKWVYGHVDKILTLSPKLSDYVIGMGADGSKVELLPFSVDIDEFNPNANLNEFRERLGIAKNDKVVVFIGTLFEFSGLDLYLEQFPIVRREVPEAKLIIVGGGILEEKLKKLVTNLKLTESVILTGFQLFDMMPKYINLADICINPFIINTTTKDIIPGKIIQYLACAKPVLATPLPGMTSLLSGVERGIVYSNISEFAKNTITLLKDSEMARAIGENGYQYVKDNHDERKITLKLEMILNQLVNE